MIEEPIYKVLLAQQANIARIATGLVVSGTTGSGNNIELWGPTPNVVRLWDRPLRFIEDGTKENWERIITIVPLASDSADRVVGRNDRRLTYQVQMLIRLLNPEMAEDRQQVSTGGVVTDNPLAKKVHRLLYDFHHVFFDNMHLITDDCPGGLVDNASYNLVFSPEADYPEALVVATCSADISAF